MCEEAYFAEQDPVWQRNIQDDSQGFYSTQLGAKGIGRGIRRSLSNSKTVALCNLNSCAG